VCSTVPGRFPSVLRDAPTIVVEGHRDTHRVSRTDGHLNDEGNRSVMSELARHLVERFAP
jgi:hypothetical protein